MAQNLGDQPNFNTIAQAFYTAGNELEKSPNLPAIQGGNAIITAMQDMERRLTAQIQTVTGQIQTVAAQQQDLSAQVLNIGAHQQSS